LFVVVNIVVVTRNGKKNNRTAGLTSYAACLGCGGERKRIKDNGPEFVSFVVVFFIKRAGPPQPPPRREKNTMVFLFSSVPASAPGLALLFVVPWPLALVAGALNETIEQRNGS